MLSDTSFMTSHAGNIIHLLGKGLTEDNFQSRRDYFEFCEEHLIKMAKTEATQENVFDFLELIETNDCKLSSCVSAAVTVLTDMKEPERVYFEYLLIAVFNRLNETDETDLKDVLPGVLQNLIRLKRIEPHDHSVLYYCARLAFHVMRAANVVDPTECMNALYGIIDDPFRLLEHEFEHTEEENAERVYLASFFYLHFKTGTARAPKVYSRFYVLDKCSCLAMSVFDNDDFGKSFVRLMLEKFKDNEIPLCLLDKCHEEFFAEAAKSSVIDEQLNVRRESFESLMLYVDKLCSDAQYVVFKYTFSTPVDSGLKAELIIKMKQLLFSKIKARENLGRFQGIRLLEIVRLCCDIPNGPQCNVVENKEHVLAAITLVYVLYAFNGDGLNMGRSFCDHVTQFTETVQSAIEFTSEQFKLESAKLDCKDYKEETVPVQFQNMNLPALSTDQKRHILSQYNTTVKLIQSNLDLFKGIIKD